MTGLLVELQAARQTLDLLIKKLQVQGGEAFPQIAQPLFDAYPDLRGFRWTQYTDYFNDGDECEFGVYTWNIDLLRADGPWLTGIETAQEVYQRVRNSGDFRKDYDHVANPYPEAVAVKEFLNNLGNEALKAIFGDHVKITVTRDNVEVTDYTDHD
jgi:hypothetical protein